jgi:uncharacterized membrane protein
MDVTLLTVKARMWLLAIVVLAGAGAALLRILRTRPGLSAGLTMVAGAAALALVLERLATWAVTTASTRLDYNEWRWVLLGPWGRRGLIVGGVVALATIGLAVVTSARERRPFRRGLLIGLRAAGVAAALVVFLQPALELRHVTREPNHVAILIDDSRSMSLGEKRGGPTRTERARDLLGASAATFASWKDSHIVDFYTFSDTLQPVAPDVVAAGVPPRADATLIRDALEAVRARYEAHDLAGVVVISDGVDTGRFEAGALSGSAQDFLAGLDTRVHTAWVGRPGLVDLAVTGASADEFAFVRTAVKIEAVVRATGLPEREVPVVLRQGGQVVKQGRVRVGGDVGEARIIFEFVPDRVGKYVYELAVPVDPDEAVSGNNVRPFVLRVIRDKIRVLQVAGRPSWDERALRGWLKRDPNVDLISFFILRTPDDSQAIDPSELSLIPFPTEELFEEELGSFDVVVLQNFEYGRYGIGPYLENMRAYTERGGALVMVGGDLSFSSGGYAGTPVAEALPVELLGGDDPSRLVSTEEFRPRLTDEGRRHPISQLRFDREDNETRWNGLPALEGLNLVAGAKPGATTLLAHPFLKARSGRPLPVLAVGEYGQGRTMALLTDTAWRWGFQAAGLPGDDGRSYQKLWENAIRWLIRDPELQILHVESDQAAYAPGQAPVIKARLAGSDYEPARGAEITVLVRRGDGDRGEIAWQRVIRTGDDGEAHLDLPPPPPGAYRVTGQAKVGARLVTADDVFLVQAEHVELAHPAARAELLEAIAAATGGRSLGTAAALPQDLALLAPRIVRVDRRSDVELWSQPYLLVLALAFLGAEWALRRRAGLA